MKIPIIACICLFAYSACATEEEQPLFVNSGYTTEDEEQWFADLEQEARQGSQEARFQLAFHRDWMHGRYEQALPVLKDLADKGHREAAEVVALSYREGKGVDINFEEAARWLERAAELGSDRAQRDLEHYARRGKQ